MLKVQTIIVDAVKFHWKSATEVASFNISRKRLLITFSAEANNSWNVADLNSSSVTSDDDAADIPIPFASSI